MRITRFKAFWDFEKEEKYLNSMAQKGYNLIDYFWIRYVFERDKSNPYKYRIIFLQKRAKEIESQNYLDFLEENGVECIATYMHWAYVRSKTDSDFEIYTDKADVINHLSIISKFWLRAGLFELVVAIIEFFTVFMLYFRFGEKHLVYFILACLLLVFSSVFLGMYFKLKKQIKKIRKELIINE